MEPKRRSTDLEEKTLAEKVAVLDKDVQNLRIEFNDFRNKSISSDKEITETINQMDKKIDLHLQNEETQHKDLNFNIQQIQDSVNALQETLKEPLEIYKTAKYSMQASKWVRDVVLWLSPLVAGISGAYIFVLNYMK